MEYLFYGIITLLLILGLFKIYTKDSISRSITNAIKIRYALEKARAERRAKYVLYTHKYKIERKQAINAVDAESELQSNPDDGSWTGRWI